MRPVFLSLMVFSAFLASSLRAADNELTDAEKAAGWKLLFDGKSLAGWKGYKQAAIPEGWSAKDGKIVRAVPQTEKKGTQYDDIITIDEYGDFELTLEWKLPVGGNSGVVYRHSKITDHSWQHAIEMQVADLDFPNNRQTPKWQAGAAYDLYPAAKPAMKQGEWNAARIVARGKHCEHYLNGELMCKFEIGSDDWKARVAGSKFKGQPHFGEAPSGHITLQDHTRGVEFRNIKLRKLPAP